MVTSSFRGGGARRLMSNFVSLTVCLHCPGWLVLVVGFVVGEERKTGPENYT